MRTAARNVGFCLAVVGCNPPTTVATPTGARPSTVEERTSRCELRGDTQLWAGGALFTDDKSGRRIVDFVGATVDLEVRSFPPSKGQRVPVVLRTGGLSLEGFVEPYELELSLRHDIPLMEDVVMLGAGARVRVLGSDSSSLLVTAEYTDFEVTARLHCRDLSFDKPAKGATDRQGEPFHLRNERVAIHHRVDAPAMGELVARRDGPTLYVVERRGDFVRVIYEHGVRVNGWVPFSALVVGEGPDCDHCYTADIRDSMDRCPEDEGSSTEVESGCPDPDDPPSLERPFAGSPIYLSPDDAAPVGRTEPGAEVYVHERKGAWSRIHGKGWNVMTPMGSGLWLKAK